MGECGAWIREVKHCLRLSIRGDTQIVTLDAETNDNIDNVKMRLSRNISE